jgi:hypothetical protein
LYPEISRGITVSKVNDIHGSLVPASPIVPGARLDLAICNPFFKTRAALFPVKVGRDAAHVVD